MKKLVIYFLLGVAVFGVYRKGLFTDASAKRPYNTVVVEESDPCKGKKICALVYLAPWCPHCRKAIGSLRAFAAKARAAEFPGLKVWVGAGEPEANKAMAEQLGPNGFVDADKSVAGKFGVKSFPTYLVMDADGGIILRDGEAYQWFQEKLN